MCSDLDTMGEGYVNYDEFAAAALDQNMLMSDEQLRWVFRFLDDNESNTLTEENIKVPSHSGVHTPEDRLLRLHVFAITGCSMVVVVTSLHLCTRSHEIALHTLQTSYLFSGNLFVQNILNVVEFSKKEQELIWQEVKDGKEEFTPLTMDQFRTLVTVGSSVNPENTGGHRHIWRADQQEVTPLPPETHTSFHSVSSRRAVLHAWGGQAVYQLCCRYLFHHSISL